MSLFQSIEHKKEYRQHYSTRSMRRYGYWTMSCVRHNPDSNQCEWCRDDRMFRDHKRAYFAQMDVEAYERGEY